MPKQPPPTIIESRTIAALLDAIATAHFPLRLALRNTIRRALTSAVVGQRLAIAEQLQRQQTNAYGRDGAAIIGEIVEALRK